MNEKIQRLVSAFPDFINDDFNTAKVLANMFELVPIINSIKDGLIEPGSISSTTLQSLKEEMDIYLTQILGIEDELAPDVQIEQIMELLIEIRKEARDKKDFATSDKIRKKLEAMDIVLNDEKGGKTTWNEK